MLLSSIDWALRGGTCALVLLLAGALVRDHGRLMAARLGALFALGTGAYAITSAAGFSAHLGSWTIPFLALSAGNNVVFWAFAASLFDDGFHLRWWHAALWLVLVVAGGLFLPPPEPAPRPSLPLVFLSLCPLAPSHAPG